MSENNARIYSARITDAGALIADTKTMLASWDMTQDRGANFNRVREQNTLGKPSRKRLNDILIIFRQRYFDDPAIGNTLVQLVQKGASSQWVDPLLYFFSAQNDNTLRDIVIGTLYPRKQAGYIDLPPIIVQNTLRNWVVNGRTKSPWGDYTIKHVAQGIMATLRDFGVLEGKVNKHIRPVYVPIESFALIAFWLMQKLQSGNLVLCSDEWRLFFLDVGGVEQHFIEAHQEGLLSYYAAGSVVRIEFPASTLQEYANGILERSR